MSKLFSFSSEKAEPGSPKEQLIEFLSLLLALALAISTATAVVHRIFGRDGFPYIVAGTSMNPTLVDGQRVIVDKAQKTPSGGDIVVTVLPEAGYRFTSNKDAQYIVKRVIACPGETLEICADDVILVNGVPLEEPYLSTEAKSETYLPNYPSYIELSAGEYFIVGDNRVNSCDSRYFGVVTSEEIVGVVNKNTLDSSFATTTSIKIAVGAIVLYLLSERLLTVLLRKVFKV